LERWLGRKQGRGEREDGRRPSAGSLAATGYAVAVFVAGCGTADGRGWLLCGCVSGWLAMSYLGSVGLLAGSLALSGSVGMAVDEDAITTINVQLQACFNFTMICWLLNM